MSHIMACESGGRNVRCEIGGSASGLYQMMPKTWDHLQNIHPELRGANRNDPRMQTLAAFYLMQDNAKSLQGRGIEANATNIYLAHFLGAGGAAAALSHSSGTPLSEISALAPALRANPHIRGMNVGMLQAWASKKMGGKVSLSGSDDLEEEKNARLDLLSGNKDFRNFLHGMGLNDEAIGKMDVMSQFFTILFMSFMDKAMQGMAQQTNTPQIAEANQNTVNAPASLPSRAVAAATTVRRQATTQLA